MPFHIGVLSTISSKRKMHTLFPFIKIVNKKSVCLLFWEIEINFLLELLHIWVSDSVCGSEGGLRIQIRLDINKYGNVGGFLIVSLI